MEDTSLELALSATPDNFKWVESHSAETDNICGYLLVNATGTYDVHSVILRGAHGWSCATVGRDAQTFTSVVKAIESVNGWMTMIGKFQF
jgi:hypothetical protein